MNKASKNLIRVKSQEVRFPQLNPILILIFPIVITTKTIIGKDTVLYVP